ncbi:MAG TPA: cation:proton antiporter, partial [Xanthobacteraceae bacterium]|nr:cation:proton antiporter [Xanthobacteraceae bacterium]
MTAVWSLAALWFALAFFASLCAIYFRVSTALTEIIVGTGAQWILGIFFGIAVLGADESWIKFLAGAGAIMLTFLAG